MNRYIVKAKPILRPMKRRYDTFRKRLNVIVPKFREKDLAYLFETRFGIKKGDAVFIHSCLSRLHSMLSPQEIIEFIEHWLGENGTIIMPTFPGASAKLFAEAGEVFDVRSCPSGVGYLTNLFMRQPGVLRSVHPFKPCAAWGRHADYLVSEHHMSKLPYDERSPFYKLTRIGGKVLGLGVTSWILSFQHSVPDTYRDFPVEIHSKSSYKMRCLNRHGETVIVDSPCDLPDVIALRNNARIRPYFTDDEWVDIYYKLRSFFRVDAAAYYDKAVALARKGITVYGRY